MFTRDRLRSGDLRWLLRITLRGRDYRFSTRPIDVAWGSKSLRFSGGLTPLSFLDAVAPPGGVATEQSVQIELNFTRDTAAGWASLAAADLDLGDAQAELSMHLVGDDYSARKVVLSGPIESSQYGALNEPVRLGLSEAPWRGNPGQVPRDSEIVGSATWDTSGYKIAENAGKQFYPIIVGAPGWRNPTTGNSYPAVPALVVKIDSGGSNLTNPAVVVIGGGVLRCAGSASVKLSNRTTGFISSALTPTVGKDDRNQVVTQISATNADVPISDGDEIWAHFLNPLLGGLSDNQGKALRGADEVIRWMLDRSGARVNTRALRAGLRGVRSYRLDFAINSSVDPISWLLDALLPFLPLASSIGPDGFELARFPYDATRADSTWTLDLSRTTGERLGDVQRSAPSRVLNHLAVEYAPGGPEGYLGRFAYVPSKRIDQTDREVHPYSRASASRFGEREGNPIISDVFVDSASARRSLDWMIRWLSQTHETVTYQLPQEFQGVPLLSVGQVTDTDIGWSNRLCVALSVLRREGPTELTVMTLPDWARDGIT